MDTQTKFAEGDLVTTSAFSPALEGLRGNLVREPEQSNFPWRFVLTVSAQAAYSHVPLEKVTPGSPWDRDRQIGWLVTEDEIRKVPA